MNRLICLQVESSSRSSYIQCASPVRESVRLCGAVSAIGLLLLLGGCASVDKVAEQPITSNTEQLAKVDLVALLDPDSKSKLPAANNANNEDRGALERAFTAFYKYALVDGDEEENAAFLKRRRNSVQDRLLAASNLECGQYKSRLLRVQSGVNFGLSTFSSLLGTAGALVTGVDGARALAGGAAAANATRSHFNESYFRQLATESLTRAIDARRTEYLNQITPRRDLSIESYTVEYAVSDALEYHNQCNLISGLEYASNAVAFANDPPLRRTMQQLRESGFEGNLTLNPERARTTEEVLTAALAGPQDPVEEDPPAETVVGAQTRTERNLTPSQARRLQAKLCVEQDANLGRNTRAAIATYQELNKLSGESVESGALDPVTLADILQRSDCPKQYRSYYERHTYPTEADIKELQKKIGVTESGTLDQTTRDKVKELQGANQFTVNGILDKRIHIKIFPPV